MAVCSVRRSLDGDFSELNGTPAVARRARCNRAEQVAAVAVRGSGGESLGCIGGGFHVCLEIRSGKGVEQRRVVGLCGQPGVQERDCVGGPVELDQGNCAFRNFVRRGDRHRSPSFFM
jgi:hypothetical protein